MTGRLHPVLPAFFLVCLFFAGVPAAYALDADPVLVAAPDKKPFVMTVMGVRKAFPVAADTIRVEIGMASNSGPFDDLQSYRIVSEDDPQYAYEKFIRPARVSFPKNNTAVEAVVPDGFKAENKAAGITEFKRYSVDLKLHVPMQPGKSYAVIGLGYGSDVLSGARTAYEFRYDPADILKAPDVRHEPGLTTLTVLGLRGLDSVGNGIIRLEFGPTFYWKEGYLLRHYHVTVNGAPVGIKAMGRRSQIDLYQPSGWPFSVFMQHEVFLQMDRTLAEGDRLRVEVDPAVVSGANAAEIVFSDKRSFSSSVKVNQVGYITTAVKIAEIGRWLGSFPDEAAVLATSGESEHFREISADEIFFGASKGWLDDKEKESPKEGDASSGKPDKSEGGASEKPGRRESLQEGTASVAPHEFAKSSLKYDAPPAFEIRDALTDQVVFSGQSVLSNPGNRSEGRKQYSGENVYEIDFTAFKTPGRYYIAVPGTGRSFEFSIAADIYEEPFQTAAYGLFAQRCGIALEPPYSDWRRIACHDRGIQVTTQKKIDVGGFIDPKNAVWEQNASVDVSVRPPVYSGPELIAYFPFDGSASNAVPGGMTLSPANGAQQSFKALPNLIWDGESNLVYETKSDHDNGWTGKLKYDKEKGLSFSFWLRRVDVKGNRFDGDLLALRSGRSKSFRLACVWGVPGYEFNGSSIYSGSRFGDDTWHCHTITIGPDESDSGKWLCRVYRDGTLICSAASSPFAMGEDFTFGAVSNIGAEGCYFDDLRIYNRVLSGKEISALSERIEAIAPKRIVASGGHHDAGDYNPRSHIDVAQVLMDAYEIAPKKFFDGQLNIPEKGNGIPDILDEALWALKLWIGLQDEDGGVYNGTESDGDPNFFQTVELDPKGDYVFAKDSYGSFQFAGAMAHASRLLQSVGKKEMAADYLERARRAYDWALNHKPQTNDSKKFGEYYTVPLAYAAAQLFHTTGEDAYHQAFLDNIPWKKNSKAKMTVYGSYDLTLAAYAYAAIPLTKADATVRSDVIRAICEEADAYIAFSNKAPYKFVRHNNAPINWGTGAYEHFLTVVWHAWAFTDNKLKVKTYRDAMIKTADNTLGCNPLDLCWIVGLGSNSVHAPLHNSRFNPTGFSVRGMHVQGPDDGGKEYNYTNTLFPKRDKTPSLYCYIDAIFAIGMNEGTVGHQAETMAAFGLLLPDVKKDAGNAAKTAAGK